MHLWNIKVLAKDLGQDLISEKMGMHYYLVAALVLLFDLYFGLWWGVVRDWLFYFEAIILIVITVFGCLEAFNSNGSNEGRDFVKRVVCLSVPVGIRVTVLFIILGLFLEFTGEYIFTAASFGDPLRAYTLISYTGFVGFNIYYWWLLVKGFKQVLQYEKKP